MYPILFTLGSFDVRSYFFFFALGIIVAVIVLSKEAKREGLSSYQIAVFIVALIPFPYAVGVVNGWLFDPVFFRALGESQLVFSGGLVSFGAILGGILMVVVCSKLLNISTAKRLDRYVLTWPIVLGFLRIGCLLNSCCHGLETDSFFSLILPGADGLWTSRYPTQLMLMVFNILLFVYLWPRRNRTAFEGELTLTFLMIYSLGRLGIDAFRALPRVLGPFSPHQLTAMVIFLVSGIIYLRMRRSTQAAMVS